MLYFKKYKKPSQWQDDKSDFVFSKINLNLLFSVYVMSYSAMKFLFKIFN